MSERPDYIECCNRCPGKRCPDFIWDQLPVRPFELRGQLMEFNSKIRSQVLFVEHRDGGTDSYGPYNSPLMMSYIAGLVVGDLDARGVHPRDIELWMMPCL